MIEPPKIIPLAPQFTAVIHLKIPKDQIQHVMGPGLAELISTVKEQGAGPAGPWFTHHFKIEDEGWDFEIGVPVSKHIVAAGRVRPGTWPAMTVARTIYQGGYEGLGEAWGEMMDWLEANGRQPAGDLYECYLAGPESSPDPADWKTELTRPLLLKDS